MALITGTASSVFFDGEIPGPHGFLWGFVALEYYALILNRVWVLLSTSEDFIAINAGGPIMAPSTPSEVWLEPFSYLDNRLQHYEMLTAESEEVLHVSRANWKCALSEISEISFKISSKWGMGKVPYSGRLFVAANGREHDFILIGNQNGKEIEDALKSRRAPVQPLKKSGEELGGRTPKD